MITPVITTMGTGMRGGTPTTSAGAVIVRG